MSSRPSLPRRCSERDSLWLSLSVLAYVAMTVWWLTQDTRVQDFDNGLHTLLAFTVRDQLAAGQLSAPFTDFNTYPPLVHIVGALGVLLGGRTPAAVILASNLVFVPLLVAGCYGVGRLAYGPRAGVLAALFALGTPMVVSETHEFLIDPPQAAMVAVSVWAILATRRFERVGMAAVAGALTGLALLTKETSEIFLAGLLVVVVVRGGWRAWRGLLAFALTAAVVGGPWYVDHFHALTGLVSLHDSQGLGSSVTPARFSRSSLTWYFWDLLNIQVLAPLALFVLIGCVLALRRLWPGRRVDDLAPELLGGAFVSWLGMTLITHKDPRYTLPALVYLAVLGTGWIAGASASVARWSTAALLAVVLANFLGVSLGIGAQVRLRGPGAPGAFAIAQRQLTLYSPDGWLRGGPARDGDVLALMRGLRRVGVRTVTFDGGSSNVIDFNIAGLQVRAIEAGLAPRYVYDPGGLGPRDAFVLRHVMSPGDPPPCQRLQDGSGVYVVLGDAFKPFEAYTFLCPGHTPLFYRRSAPLSPATAIALNPTITGAPRRLLLAVMGAMRAQGIRRVEFDPASANQPFFNRSGLQALAVTARLALPPVYDPGALGPRDAFMLRHPAGPGNPAPCATFPDGSGLYIVLGSPVIPFASYRLYCPLRRPHFYPAR